MKASIHLVGTGLGEGGRQFKIGVSLLSHHYSRRCLLEELVVDELRSPRSDKVQSATLSPVEEWTRRTGPRTWRGH